MKYHNIPAGNHLRVNLGLSEAKRYDSLKTFIASKGHGPTSLVFFCHGLKTKIQLGLTVNNVKAFVQFLKTLIPSSGSGGSVLRSPPGLTVILYACSTGSGPGVGGDGGFADKLRDALCEGGFTQARVYGHETSGHTVRNPRKRIFEGRGSPVGGMGGTWIVAPGTLLFKKWQKELAKSTSSLKYRFPYMTLAAIHTELLTL